MTASDVPLIHEFDPYKVPYQIKVISKIRQEHNYNLGPIEIMLSGAVGSAKSLLLAHLISTHARNNPGAGVMIGRRVLKDLKNTIWSMLLKHDPMLVQYWNKSEMTIRLPNSSIIYGVSWDDGNLEKFRSYPLSMGVIEELTENKTLDAYRAIRMRIGRCLNVKENVMICATNPDSPTHEAYQYFFEDKNESRHVFRSKSSDNPFLPSWYIESLRNSLDPKMAKRMLEGEWIEINQDRVYYCYEDDRNYIDKEYKWDTSLPLDIMFDFNNSKSGAPMSLAAGQYKDGKFHIGKTWIISGMRTLDMCDEVAASGMLDMSFPSVRLFGDATGKHSDTRSNKSDWELIENFFANFIKKDKSRLYYRMEVGLSNPPIKERHNIVNSLFLNDLNQVSMFIYKDAKDAGKGFRLTQLIENASLKEDDSLREQHVTTAIGYYCVRVVKYMRPTQSIVIS